MATVITGDMDMFDQLVNGSVYRVPAEKLQQQQQEFLNNVVPASRGFFQRAWDRSAQMANNRAVHRARAAARKVQSIWQTDTVRILATIGEFQNAPQTMRRFIMAEPVVRSLWKDQMLDGYNDEFEETADKEEHDLLEYGQVMDGEIIMTPDDDEYEYEINCYHDDVLDDFPILNISRGEIDDIRESWDNLRDLVLYGDEDPTSPQNKEKKS